MTIWFIDNMSPKNKKYWIIDALNRYCDINFK